MLDSSCIKKENDVRLFFSAGKRDGLTIKTLINYIKDNAKVGASQIRDIDIMENFTFVNVDDSNSLDKFLKNVLEERLIREE